MPFTSGILIGIGENRSDRISSLLRLRALHEQHTSVEIFWWPFTFSGVPLAKI